MSMIPAPARYGSLGTLASEEESNQSGVLLSSDHMDGNTTIVDSSVPRGETKGCMPGPWSMHEENGDVGKQGATSFPPESLVTPYRETKNDACQGVSSSPRTKNDASPRRGPTKGPPKVQIISLGLKSAIVRLAKTWIR